MTGRPVFSTRFATLMTMAGVAIGLGNVWRFPYMMGRHGGSAFLFVYLLLTFLFAVPALMAEWALGRATRRGPVGAFSIAFGAIGGRLAGALLMATVLIADSYYLVVIAGIVYAMAFSITPGFSDATHAAYLEGLGDGMVQYAIALGLLVLTLEVVRRGLRRGIETTSKLFVPFAGVIVLVLVAHTLSLPGALEQLSRFLRPDFSLLGVDGLFAALGQTFFSVGLGGTFMLVYGSYLRDTESIPANALLTALGDAGAAVTAALFIVPAILVFGLDMASGPGLVFETLPRLFAIMPGGRLVGSLFLFALTVMAFLSNVAALEVFVGGAGEMLPAAARHRTILIAAVLAAEAALMLPSAIHPSLIGHLDLIFGSGMQVFGSALAVTALAWGLGRRAALAEIFGPSRAAAPGHTGPIPSTLHALLLWWLRWAVPGALLAILFLYIRSRIE